MYYGAQRCGCVLWFLPRWPCFVYINCLILFIWRPRFIPEQLVLFLRITWYYLLYGLVSSTVSFYILNGFQLFTLMARFIIWVTSPITWTASFWFLRRDQSSLTPSKLRIWKPATCRSAHSSRQQRWRSDDHWEHNRISAGKPSTWTDEIYNTSKKT